MRIRSIIFDLDGTLADTAIATRLAMQEAAPGYGLPVPALADIRRATGTANPQYYFDLFRGVPKETVIQCGREIERAEAEHIRRLGRDILFHGVREMLAGLTDLGMALHIASTGEPRHVQVLLESGEIARCFQSVHCGQPQKSKMLGGMIGQTEKSAWLMICDRLIDIAAARDNGIAVFGAGMGYANASEYHLFDRVIASPEQLIDWVCPYA